MGGRERAWKGERERGIREGLWEAGGKRRKEEGENIEDKMKKER